MGDQDMAQDNGKYEYKSGAELLAAFPKSREQKLEIACRALMKALDEIHTECKDQSLADNLTNTEIFCGCADAYRMGHEALKA